MISNEINKRATPPRNRSNGPLPSYGSPPSEVSAGVGGKKGAGKDLAEELSEGLAKELRIPPTKAKPHDQR